MPKNECINNIETNEGKMRTRPDKNNFMITASLVVVIVVYSLKILSMDTFILIIGNMIKL